MPDQAPPVRFIDGPHAPEVYATAHTGIWLYEGQAHITLEAVRMNYENPNGPIQVNRVVIGRVVLPVAAATALANHILQMVENPQAPPPVAPPGEYLN